ncbi:DUF4373 domain-containing protein [Dehalogenimonas sp. THU2]|uniref:DUF4373 domain-containing protein n=1 Tax=Dehalogenimonas sp. THU2 TaxID=3151121 RepID=UPI003218CB21
MNKDTYYFAHDYNAHTDLKIRALRKHYGWEGYGWFWFIIETLRGESEYSLQYSEFVFESLSEEMKCEPADAKKFIDHCVSFGLLKMDAEKFFSPRLNRNMGEYQDSIEQRRQAGKISASKRKKSTTVQRPFNDRSTSVQQLNKTKLNKTSTPLTPQGDDDDVVKFFESNTGYAVTPAIAETLKTMVDEHGEEKVRDAARAAAIASARSPARYMDKVLRGDAARPSGNGHRKLNNREVVVNAV